MELPADVCGFLVAFSTGHAPLRFRTVAVFTVGGVAIAVMTVVLVIAQT